MTRIEYDYLRKDRPELKLVSFDCCSDWRKEQIKAWSVTQVVGHRMAMMLGSPDPGDWVQSETAWGNYPDYHNRQ